MLQPNHGGSGNQEEGPVLKTAFRFGFPVLLAAGMLAIASAGALAQTPPPPPSLPCTQAAQQSCINYPNGAAAGLPQPPPPPASPYASGCGQIALQSCGAFPGGGPTEFCEQSPAVPACSGAFGGSAPLGAPGYVSCVLDNIPVLIPMGYTCPFIGAVSG